MPVKKEDCLMKHYPVIDFHKTGLNLYHLRDSRGAVFF